MGSGLTSLRSEPQTEEEDPDNPLGVEKPSKKKKNKDPKSKAGENKDIPKVSQKDRPQTSKKKDKEKDDVLVMDERLYYWLPPRAKDMDEDREALRTVFSNCDGEKWYIKIGWKTYDDPARWFGVKVDRNRVRSFELPQNELKGSIPREIGSLIKIKSLNLENNMLSGPIPAPVVLMTQTQLTSWSLKGNLNLSLPTDIGAVTVLTTLNLPGQNLTGRVPGGIMYLKCLKAIDLSQNRLTGPIPDESFKWTRNLESLDLTYNLLSGSIPKSLASLEFLRIVRLACNKLDGEIPKNMEQLTMLGELQVRFFNTVFSRSAK
mmetsp:Transcript_50296/g.64461  ORF Transcript_50296/g.64461 Transcript_50296/m.64461 type:complete len:319 (-) Transcript_50296:1183-2139(-)